MKKGIIIAIITSILLIIGVFIMMNKNGENNNSNSNNSEKCIVTIDNQKYNVTELRKTHPGGNIFICGTDMSETFNNQHGSDKDRLNKYIYNE